MAGYRTLTKFGRTYILAPATDRGGHMENANFQGTKCALVGITRKCESIEDFHVIVNKIIFDRINNEKNL